MIQVRISVNGVDIFDATAQNDGTPDGTTPTTSEGARRYKWRDSKRHTGELVHPREAGPLSLVRELLAASMAAEVAAELLNAARLGHADEIAAANRKVMRTLLIGAPEAPRPTEGELIGELAAASALELSDNTDPDLDGSDLH